MTVGGDSTSRPAAAIILILGALSLAVYGYGDAPENIRPYALADDIRDNITKGNLVDYDNYYIMGYDLSSLKINGDAHFNNSIFQDGVDFNSTNFEGKAYFEGAKFNKLATFNDADFSSAALFIGANFGDNVTFVRAKFRGDALFWGDTRFNRDAFFNAVRFNYANFVGARRILAFDDLDIRLAI